MKNIYANDIRWLFIWIVNSQTCRICLVYFLKVYFLYIYLENSWIISRFGKLGKWISTLYNSKFL